MTTDSAGVGSFQLIQLAQVSMGVPTLCARTRSYGEAIAQPIQNSLYTLLEVQVGGYTACGIPLVRSANGNGNGIPLNGILFNGIPFPFVSVKKIFESSVSVRFR